MAGYTKLIKENVAPQGAAYIGVYDTNGAYKGNIALGTLAKSRGTKLFSFGLLSDIHLTDASNTSYPNSELKFNKALTFLKSYGCEIITVNGDVSVNQATDEYAKYKSIRSRSGVNIYTCAGNHEMGYYAPYGTAMEGRVSTKDQWTQYTGMPDINNVITITKSGKKFYFIFISVKNAWDANHYVNDDITGWLTTTLANCTDGKCFVFLHVPFADRAGDFGYNYDTRKLLRG